MAGALLILGQLASVTPALAQSDQLTTVGGEVAPPIEIVMGTAEGELQCLPPRARLPAEEPLTLRVRNISELPVTFVAPEFFKAADMVETTDTALDASTGGFLVPPEDEVQMVIRESPPVGEYGYACSVPGVQPTVQSSGFLILVPPPAE
ncbi:hypothetical protein VQ042_19225 [Aurantimonas sp. A2-1-M11]|uniref:hypothetical protein n=1 Tax=Aurantimonas sp. A2-1-M11 TaxID=3113712 RepID=UPI002F92D82B